ncbi:MAG: hypothetical protein V3W41_20555 [Planctomycetota bacterium]
MKKYTHRYARALVALGFALCLVPLAAQVTMVLDAANPGTMDRSYMPSSAYPLGAPDNIGPFPLPSAALLPAAILPAGGMACDQTTSTVYVSDGVLISMDANSPYLLLNGLPFPIPVPPAPAIPPLPGPGLPPFGPITGLAVDVAAGILWASDPFSYCAYPLAPPYLPLIAASIPIPGIPLGGPPISGLGFESSTGTLWACDVGGLIYNFTPAGLPVGPQPVGALPFVVAPLNGLAVNTSNGPGGFAPPPCSGQVPSNHINVTDGFAVYDVAGISPPIPLAFASGAGAYGLAYSSDFQISLGFAGCPSAPIFPLPGLMKEAHVGPGGGNALVLVGGPPLATIALLADLCVIPGGLFIPGSGETLWISPFTPSYVMGFALTDVLGNASIPVTFVPAPAGVQFSFQWAFPDALAPLGVCLSDAVTITTGLP